MIANSAAVSVWRISMKMPTSRSCAWTSSAILIGSAWMLELTMSIDMFSFLPSFSRMPSDRPSNRPPPESPSPGRIEPYVLADAVVVPERPRRQRRLRRRERPPEQDLDDLLLVDRVLDRLADLDVVQRGLGGVDLQLPTRCRRRSC